MRLALPGGVSLSLCPIAPPMDLNESKIELLWQIWVFPNNVKSSELPSVISKFGNTVRQGSVSECWCCYCSIWQGEEHSRAVVCASISIALNVGSDLMFCVHALCVCEREREGGSSHRRLSPRHLHVRVLESSIRLSHTCIARAENRSKPQSLPTAHKDLIPTYLILILGIHYLEIFYLRSRFFYLCIIYVNASSANTTDKIIFFS
jgi:hypothetical protein